jgi:hypothetical protein
MPSPGVSWICGTWSRASPHCSCRPRNRSGRTERHDTVAEAGEPGGDAAPPGQDVLLSYGKPGVASTDQDDVNCGGCVPAKVSTSSGNLVLQARREVTPGSACPPDPVSGGTTCQYTSARINTSGKFSFIYVHVEARIKVSGTPGPWPAFWLLGSNFFDKTANWPNCGEIDNMEHVRRDPSKSYSTLHAPAYNGTGGIGAPLDLGTDVSAAFHVFGVDRDSTHMTFTVDGDPFLTLNRDTVESTLGPWVYDTRSRSSSTTRSAVTSPVLPERAPSCRRTWSSTTSASSSKR